MALPKRRTIGDNPLNAVIPGAPSRAAAAVAEPVEVKERAKNAVFWTPGLTLANLAAQAFTNAVDRLEKKRGEAFPPRNLEPKGGRPMK